MAVVGWIAVGVVAVGVAAAVVVGVSSIPDIQRYMRIRHM